jgi:MFS family permease
VRTLLFVIAGASLFGFPFQVLMPVLARDVLGLGAQAYGWMVTSAGVGALAGALGLAGFARHIRKGRAVAVAAITFGLLVALLGVVRSFPLILVLLVLIGFAMIVHTATTNTLLQTVAPDALRGRVMSVYTLSFMGLLPFGSLLSGLVAERFGPGVWLTAGGLVCCLIAIMTLRAVPEVWRME